MDIYGRGFRSKEINTTPSVHLALDLKKPINTTPSVHPLTTLVLIGVSCVLIIKYHEQPQS